jgi:acyl-CoA reductase-like NAD-dependent aldehyde dehydrogenase
MGVSDGLPALLAGNAVVHKPDSQTVLTALFGARLLREAGVPDGRLAARSPARDRSSAARLSSTSTTSASPASTRTGA